MRNRYVIRQQVDKEFLSAFNWLCHSRNSWQVWADLIRAQCGRPDT